MSSKVLTHSLVRIGIQVRTGTYGPECTMQQIIDQASKEGLQAAKALVAGKASVVGEPKVLTVTTEPDGGPFAALLK